MFFFVIVYCLIQLNYAFRVCFFYLFICWCQPRLTAGYNTVQAKRSGTKWVEWCSDILSWMFGWDGGGEDGRRLGTQAVKYPKQAYIQVVVCCCSVISCSHIYGQIVNFLLFAVFALSRKLRIVKWKRKK